MRTKSEMKAQNDLFSRNKTKQKKNTLAVFGDTQNENSYIIS